MPAERNLVSEDAVRIVGIDLAWGEKNPDGLCLIRASRSNAEIVETALTFGDEALIEWLRSRISGDATALLAVDAPLVIPNISGSRWVDRKISSLFGKHEAGCHPANASLCRRPLRVAQLLREEGFAIDFDLQKSHRIATEVYPHPAMIRLFNLAKTLKYKKRSAARNDEFRQLQCLIRSSLERNFPRTTLPAKADALLSAAHSKGNEDQTDAMFCALIGLLHWQTRGSACEVVGSLEEGFILLPPVPPAGIGSPVRLPSSQS